MVEPTQEESSFQDRIDLNIERSPRRATIWFWVLLVIAVRAALGLGFAILNAKWAMAVVTAITLVPSTALVLLIGQGRRRVRNRRESAPPTSA